MILRMWVVILIVQRAGAHLEAPEWSDLKKTTVVLVKDQLNPVLNGTFKTRVVKIISRFLTILV